MPNITSCELSPVFLMVTLRLAIVYQMTAKLTLGKQGVGSNHHAFKLNRLQ